VHIEGILREHPREVRGELPAIGPIRAAFLYTHAQDAQKRAALQKFESRMVQ
jgi:hypothetical protein